MIALEGIKVADFTTMIAGPYASTLLADLGADVIKIEPLDGEPWRRMGGIFLGANRGKRGLALDLRSREGLEIVRKLIATSDIFVENTRLGVTKRLGLDYESLVKLRPDLIYVSIMGHGSNGPYAAWPGFDPLLQARGGMMAGQGGPEKTPVYYKIAVNDLAAPMLGVYGAMLALYHRKKTGRGQHIETSLTNAAATMQSGDFVDYAGLERQYPGDPDLKGLSATHRLYETADRWIFVMCVNESNWQALCRATGQFALLQDHRFATSEARQGYDDALVESLAAAFRTDTAANWLSRLKGAGVPCAPQPTLEEALKDPHFLQTQALVDHDHPEFGRVRQPGLIPRFSDTPGKVLRPTPTLGQHNDQILADLGYTPEEIKSLRERKLIG